MPGHRIRTKLASPNGMQSLIGLSSRRRQNRREGYLSRDLMKQISADSPKNTSNGCLRQGLDDSAKMRLCLSYSDAAPPFSFKTKRKSYTSKLYVLSQSRNPEDTDCESSSTLKTGSGYENMVSESRTGSGKSVTLCYRSSSLDSIPEGESPMTDERLKLTGGPCVSPPAPKRLSRFSAGGCEQLTAVPGLLITPVFEDRDTSRDASGLFRRPINKFRRMARAVLMLIQVCNICKERELVQLTFDVAEFKRDHRTEFLLTDEVREVMRVMPGNRRPDQVVEILRCLKALSKDFANYSLATQKLICQHAFYDKYRFNRVILKKGLQADGIYFVLSGSLIEKHDTRKHPKEITVGEKFGENDLLCGNKRRHTVLTRTDTELFYLHRQVGACST
ncbi:hypothetical protein BaRGS_00017604 [Batillaria attramentaria]|uniref:Cyclic nucleotide-binding domain-containing protein n=1 Tax=Batillaria attramentaria TaxID=370345 RepID=A0ABD0KVP1_9CAEN